MENRVFENQLEYRETCLFRYYLYFRRIKWEVAKANMTKVITICCRSVTKLCPTLYNPVSYSNPGSSVLPYLLEFAQIHIYWVSDAIQPSHTLPPSSPFAFNLPPHHSLFQWIGSSQLFPSGGQSIRASALATVLSMNSQGWFSLGLTGLISVDLILCSHNVNLI